MGIGGDGQRDVRALLISAGRTSVGRDVLVVDIDLAIDVPVMGWHTIGGHITRFIIIGFVVAVVDDGLRAVYEVA